MKNPLLSFCLFLLPFSVLQAQPGDCDCFDTALVLARDTQTICRYYEYEVSHDGNCKHGLSNVTLEIECGTVSDTWNSLNSPVEENFLDPNNGLWGVKVDDIQDFGEGSEPDSFRLGFIFCPYDEYCADWQSYWEPIVAYKAGGCILYDTLDLSTLPGFTPTATIAPNPIEGSATITFTTPGPGRARLEIWDLWGHRLRIPLAATFEHQQRLHREIEVSDLEPGLYLYRVVTDLGRSAGRFVVQ